MNSMKVTACLLALPLLLAHTGGALVAEEVVSVTYYAYICAESDDTVDLISFGPEGGKLLKRIPVGVFPNEIEGPHGVKVSPDGRHWYVSIAHGLPYGSIFKYPTDEDISVGDVQVGLFPASLDISPTTGFLFVVNFNLHGEMVPSTVSVVDTVTMTEIAQIDQGVMPHGSRLSADGRFHYSVAMMSDELYEIDALSLRVSRKLRLTKDDQPAEPSAGHEHAAGGHAAADPMAVTRPTWVQPHPSRPYVYVALQGVDQVVEVDRESWTIRRRFHTQRGPYNLAVSPDGSILVVTCKLDGSTAFWDLESGEELASVPNSRKVTHGAVVTPDSRYAFVTVEGIGGEPGTVDVFDLKTLERVAAIDVGKQASGIDFWKME